jgi:hypothetical protein
MDEWMRNSELEESTSNTYAGYIERTIVPALGHVPIKKIDARTLERASTPNCGAAAFAATAHPLSSTSRS